MRKKLSCCSNTTSSAAIQNKKEARRSTEAIQIKKQPVNWKELSAIQNKKKTRQRIQHRGDHQGHHHINLSHHIKI